MKALVLAPGWGPAGHPLGWVRSSPSHTVWILPAIPGFLTASGWVLWSLIPYHFWLGGIDGSQQPVLVAFLQEPVHLHLLQLSRQIWLSNIVNFFSERDFEGCCHLEAQSDLDSLKQCSVERRPPPHSSLWRGYFIFFFHPTPTPLFFLFSALSIRDSW